MLRHFRINCNALSVIALLLVSFGSVCNGYMVGNNPHYRSETLDSGGRYQLEWSVDFDQKRITFNVTVQTNGYVAFGLSQNGSLNAMSDIVIGGVNPNGKTYFTDRYSMGNQMSEVDEKQDWILHDARESASHTFLSFSRDFDTCDANDFPITTDRVSLIWAFGGSDVETFLHHHRGSYDVYLLDPDYSPKIIRSLQDAPAVIGKDSSDLKTWTIPKKTRIAPNGTSYFCSVHKAPKLMEKHHLVGFNVHFPKTEEEIGNLMSVFIYKCNAPHGLFPRDLFDKFVSSEDKEDAEQSCFVLERSQGPIPTSYCTELIHKWSGHSYFTPSDIGFPFGVSQDEYYLVQSHYEYSEEPPSNNATLRNVQYELELFYTHKIRAHDAGVLVVGHEVPGMPPSMLVPANTSNHVIYGHCGSECTRIMLPTSGVRIFAVGLHSHNSGKDLRLQQFRNTRELAWISSDSNYDPQHKQIRNLRQHVRMLPSDHLIMRCVYDSTVHGETLIGGFSSKNEQCLAYIYYYDKINEFTNCKSEIISEDYMQRFLGISNITWDNTNMEYVVDQTSQLFESAYLGGVPLTSVSDGHVDWEPEVRAEFERFHRYHPQINSCFKEPYARVQSSAENGESVRRLTRAGATRDDFRGATTYPFSSKEYIPEGSCSIRHT